MKIRRKKRIFTKIILCFLILPILLLLTAFACLMLDAIILSRGSIENLFPYHDISEDGELQNFEALMEIGGWVEELDEQYRVLRVYGDKLSDAQQYTQTDIYDLLSLEGESDYIGFLTSSPQGGYYLYLYRRGNFQVNFMVNLSGDNTATAYRRTDWFLFLFFLLAAMEVLLLGLYLRRKIKKPLDRLTEGMERFKAGESGVALDIPAEAEFQQIIETFNLMTDELEKQTRENARLVAQKNQTLLELSHDIKTPVATIKSYANALEAGLVPEEKKTDYYRTIDRKAERVTALTEDMFFLLKMDNPDYVPALELVDIGEFLRKICTEYYDEIEEAGFDFSIDIPEEAVFVSIDERLFVRVIGNLLSNALKYNQTGKQIGVILKKDDKVVIEVFDDGCAIDAELAGQMFTAFVRGDKTRKSDGGTGLGLAISKVIVEKHGGEIGYRRTKGRNLFFISLKAL